MKDKLKTLKDLETEKDQYLIWLLERFERGEEPFERILKYIYNKNRTEAIKWVKHINERLSSGVAFDFKETKVRWEGQRDFIKYFFNLKEDDLI